MTRRMQFSPTQDRIFQFVVDYKREHNGNSPTYQEIADEMELSKVTVYNRVMRLVVRMRLELDENRRIVVPEGEFVYRAQPLLVPRKYDQNF